jgi:hypothetical protein
MLYIDKPDYHFLRKLIRSNVFIASIYNNSFYWPFLHTLLIDKIFGDIYN